MKTTRYGDFLSYNCLNSGVIKALNYLNKCFYSCKLPLIVMAITFVTICNTSCAVMSGRYFSHGHQSILASRVLWSIARWLSGLSQLAQSNGAVSALVSLALMIQPDPSNRSAVSAFPSAVLGHSVKCPSDFVLVRPAPTGRFQRRACYANHHF